MIGQPLLRLTGARITFEEAVALGERESFALQIAHRTYILLEEPACYVNHSCNPNTGLRNGVLVALRPILAMEELRYDYSTTMDEDYWSMECSCGEAACRGVVRDFVLLPEATQRRYLRAGIVQPFIERQLLMEKSGVYLVVTPTNPAVSGTVAVRRS